MSYLAKPQNHSQAQAIAEAKKGLMHFSECQDEAVIPDRDFFKPHNRKPKLQRKGTRDRRITVVKIVDGREHCYHVTKGWRTRRA